MKGWMRAACAASLAALASCAGDDGAEPIEAAAFCDAFVATVCEGLSSCCGGAFNAARCELDQREVCEQDILTLDDRGLAPTGPRAPARIVFDFDEEGAGEALASLKSQLAQCSVLELETSMFDATHFLGEPGAECLRNEDCIEGTRCEQPPLAVFGTCVIAPLEGESCTDVCASRELACVVDPSDVSDVSICVAPRGEGQSCQVVGCKQGLVCDSGSDGMGPRCVPGGREGETCTAHEACLSGFCGADRECAPAPSSALCNAFDGFGF